MNLGEMLMIVPNPVLSGIIWLLLLVLIMYFARSPAHFAIRSFSRVIHSAMRLSARAVMRAESRLNERNREVILAQGREAAERIIEREFDRIDATVRRDLAEYPALHRVLSEEITVIDEDYKNSTEVPPEPPAWVKAVDAVERLDFYRLDRRVVQAADVDAEAVRVRSWHVEGLDAAGSAEEVLRRLRVEGIHRQ